MAATSRLEEGTSQPERKESCAPANRTTVRNTCQAISLQPATSIVVRLNRNAKTNISATAAAVGIFRKNRPVSSVFKALAWISTPAVLACGPTVKA